MKKIFLILLIPFIALSSCKEEDDLGPSIIDTSTPTLNSVDIWIRSEYTTPYNIEVKYKWDDTELENDKILVPPVMDNILPFLTTMRDVWIDPYKIEGGENFIKTYIPKLLVLVGSRNYNNDGTITQGQAESGKKVTMYELNYFDRENIPLVKRQFHVMHHEFAHILHQTVMYPVEYTKLTPEGYTSTWYNFTDKEANEEGFITNYSKADPNEDFVEMIATLLTNSKDEFNTIIEGISSEDAKTILRVKESYVVNYFAQVWNIDLYALQKRINDAMIATNKSVE